MRGAQRDVPAFGDERDPWSHHRVSPGWPVVSSAAKGFAEEHQEGRIEHPGSCGRSSGPRWSGTGASQQRESAPPPRRVHLGTAPHHRVRGARVAGSQRDGSPRPESREHVFDDESTTRHEVTTRPLLNHSKVKVVRTRLGRPCLTNWPSRFPLAQCHLPGSLRPCIRSG